MKTRNLILAFILLSGVVTTALAQRKVTLYYDANSKGVENKKQCIFYREMTFDDQKRPVGEIRDYWKNGKLQTLAQGALYVDRNDDSKSLWTGKVILFDKRGKKIQEANFSSTGKPHGNITTYDAKEKPLMVHEYDNGLPANNWYIRYENATPVKISYLNHMPMTALTEDLDIYPLVERKIVYNDGRVIQYYYEDGLSIAVQFTEENLYGKYYASYITIENGTDKELVLNPDDFMAISIKGGKARKEEIIPYNTYMKKVKRKQGWSSFFNSFAESQAASQAGYSALASAGAGAAIDNSGGAVLAYGESAAVSHSGSAQYAANQQAKQNIQQYDNAQYEIRNSISQGYLKINTIMPHSRLIGYVNVKKSKMEGMLLNIPIRGKIYQFQW